MPKNNDSLAERYKNTWTMTSIIIDRDVYTYFTPPGGLSSSEIGQRAMIHLDGARLATSTNNLFSTSKNTPVEMLSFTDIYLNFVKAYQPTDKQLADLAALEAPEPVEEAPTPKRRRRKSAKPESKPTPKAKVSKRTRSAVVKAIQAAHAASAVETINTFIDAAIGNGATSKADLTAVVMPQIAKGQVYSAWNDEYSDLDEPISADEWAEMWAAIDFEGSWNDFDALWGAVNDFFFD